MQLKPFLGLALLLASQAINAEPQAVNTQFYCEDTPVVVEALRKEFTELPYVTGLIGSTADPKGQLILWVNPKTSAWTLTATIREMTCVLGSGTKLQLVNYDNI